MTPAQVWRLSRPPTLAASIVPVAVGTAAGALSGPISWPLTADMAAVAILLQAATNMTNEYHDYVRGVDEAASIGIAGVLVRGEMPGEEVRASFITTFLVAIALGLVLAWVRGPVLLALGFLSVAVAYLYNAGPWPISSTPFGEAVVFLVMGPLEVLVSEVAAVGHVTWGGAWASVPVAALVAVILLANNLRDHDADKRHGRRTLPIVVGPPLARRLLVALVALALLWPGVAWLAGWLPVWAALALLAAPVAFTFVRRLTAADADLRGTVPEAARLELVTGILLAAGLGLTHLG